MRNEPNSDMQINRSEGAPARVEDRRGSITSILALLLSLAVIVLSVMTVAIPLSMATADGVTDYGGLVVGMARGLASAMASLMLMVPTVLLALRSASKPKGHVGRGRGLFSVIVSVTFPVMFLGIGLAFAFGQARSVMESGVVAKTAPADDGSIRLVAPGYSVTVSDDVASLMDGLGLLPEQTVEEDGTLPVTSKNGRIYVGEQELDAEALREIIGTSTQMTDSQLEEVARQIESLERLGYSLGVDEGGQVVAIDPHGNSAKLVTNEDGSLSIDASTTIDLNAIDQVAQQFGISLDDIFG